MKQENLNKFIDYGNPLPSDSVLYMFLGQLAFSLIIVVMGYNWLKALTFLAPVIIITTVIYIVFLSLKEKRENKKYIFLFFGMMAILCSVTCQFGCFFMVELTERQKLSMAIVLFVITLLIYVSVFYVSKIMIDNSGKFSKAQTVSTVVIAPFAVLGVIASRKIANGYQANVFSIVFAIFSFVFAIFFIYIIKYFCIIKLEKIKQINTDENTGTQDDGLS